LTATGASSLTGIAVTLPTNISLQIVVESLSLGFSVYSHGLSKLRVLHLSQPAAKKGALSPPGIAVFLAGFSIELHYFPVIYFKSKSH
jgi:hypothetical protein